MTDPERCSERHRCWVLPQKQCSQFFYIQNNIRGHGFAKLRVGEPLSNYVLFLALRMKNIILQIVLRPRCSIWLTGRQMWQSKSSLSRFWTISTSAKVSKRNREPLRAISYSTTRDALAAHDVHDRRNFFETIPPCRHIQTASSIPGFITNSSTTQFQSPGMFPEGCIPDNRGSCFAFDHQFRQG